MKRSNYHYLIAAGLLTCSYLGLTSVAHAEDIHVTRFTDTPFDGTCDADCSLREAIDKSNGNGQTNNVIILDSPGTYVLDIAGGDNDNQSGDLDILSDQVDVLVKNVTIKGLGADQTTIDATGLGDRVIHVPQFNVVLNDQDNIVSLTLEDLSITGGNTGSEGAGVLFDAGSLIDNTFIAINNCHIFGNTAGTVGAGLLARAGSPNATNQAFINNSTFSENNAGAGGGISLININAEINNSTISGNTATGTAGGVDAFTEIDGIKISINSSTIFNNNSFDPGAGLAARQEVDGQLTLTLANTILVGNLAQGNASDCDTTDPLAVVSHNFNIFGEVTGCEIVNQSGDQVIADLVATPVVNVDLADNGGPTPTHALFAGSPAVNNGNPDGCFNGDGIAAAPNTELTTDQRLNTPRVVGGRCDVGAYELSIPVDLSLAKTVDEPIAVVGDTLVYTLTVTNKGANDATNVVLTDDLPSEVTFVSVTPADPTCSHAAGVVTCQVGTLNPDESFEATVTVKVASVPANEQLLNTASVGSDELDTNSDDNSASATTTVLNARNLSGAGVSCSLSTMSASSGWAWLSFAPLALMLLLRRKA